MLLREKLLEKARAYVRQIYSITKHYPDQEKYGLTKQLRTASLSIVLNFREGIARYSFQKSKPELKYFINIAYGSSEECQELLSLSMDFKYYDQKKLQQLIDEVVTISKLTNTYLQKIQQDIESDS